MSRIVILLLLCGLSFSSCKIPTYAKEKRGQKCELHHLTFHKSIVGITYGAYCSPRTHLGIGSEFFPNARHPKCGGCVVRPYKVVFMYSCSKCNTLKREHLLTFKRSEERKTQKIRSQF